MSTVGDGLVVRIRGALDDAAAGRVQEAVERYFCDGGRPETVAIDLRATSGCDSRALAGIARLVSVGVQLVASDRSRRTGVP